MQNAQHPLPDPDKKLQADLVFRGGEVYFPPTEDTKHQANPYLDAQMQDQLMAMFGNPSADSSQPFLPSNPAGMDMEYRENPMGHGN